MILIVTLQYLAYTSNHLGIYISSSYGVIISRVLNITSQDINDFIYSPTAISLNDEYIGLGTHIEHGVIYLFIRHLVTNNELSVIKFSHILHLYVNLCSDESIKLQSYALNNESYFKCALFL